MSAMGRMQTETRGWEADADAGRGFQVKWYASSLTSVRRRELSNWSEIQPSPRVAPQLRSPFSLSWQSIFASGRKQRGPSLHQTHARPQCQAR